MLVFTSQFFIYGQFSCQAIMNYEYFKQNKTMKLIDDVSNKICLFLVSLSTTAQMLIDKRFERRRTMFDFIFVTCLLANYFGKNFSKDLSNNRNYENILKYI